MNLDISKGPIYHVGFQAVLVVKNPPTNAGDLRDAGLTPGSGRSLGGAHGNPWRIPWTEEPGVYGPQDHKELDMTEAT